MSFENIIETDCADAIVWSHGFLLLSKADIEASPENIEYNGVSLALFKAQRYEKELIVDRRNDVVVTRDIRNETGRTAVEKEVLSVKKNGKQKSENVFRRPCCETYLPSTVSTVYLQNSCTKESLHPTLMLARRTCSSLRWSSETDYLFQTAMVLSDFKLVLFLRLN